MMYPKQEPVRSKKLRDSARGKDCTLRLPGCDGGGETSVLAHAPFGGKGMGTKPPDSWGAVACHRCHAIVDGRERADVSRLEIMEAWLRGIAETQQQWVQDGLITVAGDG